MATVILSVGITVPRVACRQAAPAAAADFVMPKFVDSLDALMM